jgi:hypothetical protein
MVKRIPYGLSDFYRVQSGDYYFVDKTSFIPKLEEIGNYLLFLRPRRFGKSFLIAMLEAYYDIANKKKFRKLFKNTYVSKHFQKNKTSFYILKFDFSQIGVHNFEREFIFYMNIVFDSFITKYNLDIQIKDNPKETFENIIEFFENSDKKLYLFIDEYDSFVNKLLFTDMEQYKEFLEQNTIIHEFASVIKSALTGNYSAVSKIFIVGVSPVAITDIIGELNTLENISLYPQFNDLVGINNKELLDIIKYYNIPTKYIRTIKDWYGGYKFHYLVDEIYNTDMVLYFINNFLQTNSVPLDMIDNNIKTDYGNFERFLVSNPILDNNFKMFLMMFVYSKIEIEDIDTALSGLKLNELKNFINLCFYFGCVSIKEENMGLILHIPNESIKKLNSKFLHDVLDDKNFVKTSILDVQNYLKEFATNGSVEIFRYIDRQIKPNLIDLKLDNFHIKALYIMLLSLTHLYAIHILDDDTILLKPLNNKVLYFGIVKFVFLNRDSSNQIMETLYQYDDSDSIKEFIQNGKQFKKIALFFNNNELFHIKWIE